MVESQLSLAQLVSIYGQQSACVLELKADGCQRFFPAIFDNIYHILFQREEFRKVV